MAKVSLDKMSLAELKTLKKDVDKAIASFEKRRIADARKEVEEVAKKHGITLDQIVPTGRKGTKSKSKAPAKYRNPENPSETWSGRGRQPEWFKAAEAAGKSRESMAV